ncbi:DNA cross-link repair 1A protein [Leuresthes tenuis]|uniref:DNA cross-link repair 1A protein n=1 Tax=Leuresthes tenuis TaxID=355514 RepID=UPI003B514726
MSQKDDSENDIWEYKPLEKKRKRTESSSVIKRRCTTRKTSKKETSPKSHEKSAKNKSAESGDGASAGYVDQNGSLDAHELTSKSSSPEETIDSDNNAAQGPTSEDYCPICQMPFFILVVQSQRWHVAECLDTPRDKCKECPDGLQCSSTIPNHYKKFNHTLFAQNRANSNTANFNLSQHAETSRDPSLGRLPGLIKNEVDSCVLESSQDSSHSLSALSTPSLSPHNNQPGTPRSKPVNGLLLLRSPGPEDFKKKKGWLFSTKRQKSVVSSQESKTERLPTPVKESGESQACEDLPKDENDEEISYSPLSELPADGEASNECRKALFDNDASEKEMEDSMILFGDSFSSEDELLSEFLDNNLEFSNVPEKNLPSSSTQLCSVSSLAPTNEVTASTVDEHRADSSGGKETCQSASEIGKKSIQSPQSVVLERLRENLLSSEAQCGGSGSSQNSSQNMPPQKGPNKAGAASGFKQTDIGVFFGLKPLKKKEAEKRPDDLDTSIPTAGENSRQRKTKAGTAADTSQATETVNGLSSAGGRGEGGRGGTRGWRRRWNRGSADGEVASPRCPFYKKIPGTKFVVDAFGYGEIEGITAYFLTHFHSDHYGGLTKRSAVPIYCNRITANLVKSKLRVAEQHVHVLPMNAEVTVDGVRVILLDANHCPGAAMLLFLLPDGQIVLHTGDFRADPSMETYPELLGYRVQTLYLDTTYCSPEYTFPRQQEVINFAASTAFELVTLKPRTLVVCGSYSVGKEKVFLALAETLGSKVCLSRDKYNTMCCLESKQVRERITTDWMAAQVHVLPMMQLSFKKLRDHLARFSRQYDQLVAFKPTGWTFSQQVESIEDIQPVISGNISIYGIPYSEHSSFLELKRFVQWLRPLKIIPTVNVGSWTSRKAMEKCFSEWLMEARAKL